MNRFGLRDISIATSADAQQHAAARAHIRIAGTGHFLPHAIRTSDAIDHMCGRSPGKTAKRTGIEARHVVTVETSSGMAIAASHEALENAKLNPSEIDLVISACAVPEQPIPAMAPLIQAGLGLGNSGVPAFDVNSSCLSFVTAFDLASQMIASGRFRNVLIASSEIASRALPWKDDPDTAAMFGDGAAAAILSASPNHSGGVVASHMETWSEGYRDCELAAGGTRFDFHQQQREFADAAHFTMDGRAAYKLAAKVIVPFMDRLLAKASWQLSDIDLVVPHQASRGALDHLVAKLKIPRDKIIDIITDHGNQIAASIPMALHYAFQESRITPGMKVLLIGTSAGFSVGGLCLEIS
jgi:3-oxoacyl-[acyl-carrier-protein] synthase III